MRSRNDIPRRTLLQLGAGAALSFGFASPFTARSALARGQGKPAAKTPQARACIYVSEALFRARISPKRLAKTVAGARCEKLVPAIKAVLRAAIEAGGSTLRDYAGTDGELGYFQHHFLVYDREGEPCPPPCPGTVKRIVQSGRSTFYCPKCQK